MARRYHVQLASGEERDITADDVQVRDGVLEFHNAQGQTAVLYGAGSWVLCEVEPRDDRE